MEDYRERSLEFSFNEEGLNKTFIKFSWADDYKNFSAEISGVSNYSVEFGLIKDHPALVVYKDSETIISYKFNREDGEWQIIEGKFNNEAKFKDEHSKFVKIYSPIFSKIMDYVQNPQTSTNLSNNKFTDFQIQDSCDVKNNPGALLMTTCSGSIHYETAFGSNEVTCCWSAVERVDGSCTNGYCLGCCQVGCISNCVGFGWYCVCDGIGRACSFCDAHYDAPGC